MAVRGEDLVVVAEVALDRPRLGGRFHDHEVLGHGGAECSTGSLTSRSSVAQRARAVTPPGGRDGALRCRGPAAGSPRRSRVDVEVSSPVASLGRADARRAAATPPRASGVLAGSSRRRIAAGPCDAALGTAARCWRLVSGSRGTGSTWYGKKNVDSIWSMKIGRLPSIIRRFVHSEAGVLGGRQVEQVDEQRLLVRGMDDDVSDHVADARAAGACRPRHPPDGPPGGGRTDRVRGGRSRSPAGRGRRTTQTPMPTCRTPGS